MVRLHVNMKTGEVSQMSCSVGSHVCCVWCCEQRGAEDGTGCEAFAPLGQGKGMECPNVPRME